MAIGLTCAIVALFAVPFAIGIKHIVLWLSDLWFDWYRNRLRRRAKADLRRVLGKDRTVR